jgi:hypothetical protein
MALPFFLRRTSRAAKIDAVSVSRSMTRNLRNDSGVICGGYSPQQILASIKPFDQKLLSGQDVVLRS